MPIPDLDAAVRGLYRAATGVASWDGTLASLRDALGAADLQLLREVQQQDIAPDLAANTRWSIHRTAAPGSECATLELGTHQGIALSVKISWPDDRRPEPALHRWLERLAPHLQDALHAAERLRQWPARRQVADLLLDALAHPAWLLEANGSIVQANAAARRVSTARRWLQSSGQVLALRSADAQRALDVALNEALVMPLARPALLPSRGPTDDGTGPAIARQEPPPARLLLRRLETPGSDPLLLAILFDPQSDEAGPLPLSAALLADAFGFTPAESRVAVCLAQGSTVRKIAALLGVAPSTVRTHLEAVMGKLGVARKLDAVRLLVQGGWMCRVWPEDGNQDA